MARRAKGLSLGAVLRRRRLQLELTQAQVAAKIRCRPNYIGYLEADARRPSAPVIARLARALDLDSSELYFLANPQAGALVGRQPSEPKSAWEEFRDNKRLHTRHGITAAELAALERVAALGVVRTQRDFLFILQTIRQALTVE